MAKLSIKDTGKSFMVSERCYKLCKSFTKVFNELTESYPIETRRNLYDLCLRHLTSLGHKMK